jgi:OOP family OmpA-OmpF porin
MKYSILKLIFVSVLLAVVSGCASHPTRSGGSYDPFCTLAGAIVGGGGAAAVALAAGPIGAGVAIGAALGTLACHQGPPAPQPVAAAPPPAPPPPPPPEPDSDGDGVVDRLDRCPGTPRGTKVDAHGCPDVLMVLTGVNFKFDSSQIEPASAQILDQAVNELRKASSVNVRIVGHTDSIGSDDYNMKLSHRRADAVRNYLVNHGISASRLTTEGRGESQPVASNDTDAGRFQNRRVELHVAGH